MIQILLLEKIYTLARCFQEDAEPKKEIRSYRAIALSSVVSKRYASCVMMRMEKDKEPETWKRLHMEGVNNISCQHLQVLVTNLSQKTLGMARGSISHVETWQRDSTNNVYGKLGHQVSLRRGKAEAYCENSGDSQYTRMVDRAPLT